ncbi:MAG: hypothetical protein KY457_02710 [Actinobacteria bacterium]|nr:hypothetical protein [Actinomycetota bacterium]
MSSDARPGTPPPPDEGGLSASSGTPVPVDVERDRRSRRAWVVFLAGPVIWITHFMVVYLIAEAGCTGDGALLDRFDPPVPVVATWVATVVAVPAAAAAAAWAWRSWRRGHPDPVDLTPHARGSTRGPLQESPLAFAGFLLSALSVIAILFTAAPALVLSCTG